MASLAHAFSSHDSSSAILFRREEYITSHLCKRKVSSSPRTHARDRGTSGTRTVRFFRQPSSAGGIPAWPQYKNPGKGRASLTGERGVGELFVVRAIPAVFLGVRRAEDVENRTRCNGRKRVDVATRRRIQHRRIAGCCEDAVGLNVSQSDWERMRYKIRQRTALRFYLSYFFYDLNEEQSWMLYSERVPWRRLSDRLDLPSRRT